ncbi:MAG: 1-deoxy-D-xylulose-5-phosphate synthase [Elusimicrobia bacterium]|nr:1-deoxy-D-xylulose-5-phosphate synthase [Elusimicrobiota bacterium]
MRKAFVQALVELALAERHPRILLLTGDLGYTVLEPFAETYPDRFFNVGVAEQNLVGLATGLAEAGFIPFVYSIATFASLRPYEFIRNGPVLHRLPVRVVGVGEGFGYGCAGPTHHALEDLGVTRIQPGLTVIAPADAQQARAAIHATKDLPGPVYFRLGKDEKPLVPGLEGRFELGRAVCLREGQDLLLIAAGSVAREVVAAADMLSARGVRSSVLLVSTLNPPPVEDLKAALAGHRVALTVEAHYVVGGLGSLVCEVAAENGLSCRVVRCGVWSAPDGASGSQDYYYRRHGLSRGAIMEAALRELRKPSSGRGKRLGRR